MSLPALPKSFPDIATHQRRVSETVNNIVNFSYDDSRVVSRAEKSASVVPVNPAFDAATGDIRRWSNSIVLDGTTDNTTAISNVWTLLTNYHGIAYIPYNCKFTKSTVYSGIPTGVVVIDDSSINVGSNAKRRLIVSNDTATKDTVDEVASSHHPARRFINLGTAGTSSATGRYHSILFASGYRWTNDPIDGMQYLTYLSPRGSSGSELWRNAWIINTRAKAAINSSHWTAATVYAANAIVDTTDGNVWQTSAGGTSGSTEPTGTGPSFTDNTVTWTWLYAWDVGSTLFYFDEDGHGEITGSAAGKFIVSTSTLQGISINCDNSSGDTWIRDEHKGLDLLRLNTANGLRFGALPSLDRGSTLSGATPSISNEFHAVTNSSATNMTGVSLPSGQNNARFTLYFTNGNTTLKATGFNLKGGIDVTPAAGNVMTFFVDTGLSGSPTEMYRNF